jgi:hypothetical protein
LFLGLGRVANQSNHNISHAPVVGAEECLQVEIVFGGPNVGGKFT